MFPMDDFGKSCVMDKTELKCILRLKLLVIFSLQESKLAACFEQILRGNECMYSNCIRL